MPTARRPTANLAPRMSTRQLNTLLRKGRLSQADREREGAPAFRAAHAAVESAVNNLEQCGLGRVLARGADGFERMVGLAGNLHRPRAGPAVDEAAEARAREAQAVGAPTGRIAAAQRRESGSRPPRGEASQRCARWAKTPLEEPERQCSGVRTGQNQP